MNSGTIITFDIFTIEQVKEINKRIKKNILRKENQSNVAGYASKIGEFSVVPCFSLMELVHPWLYKCQIINRNTFGYDIYWDFHLDELNYNVYGTGGEYDWHVDGTKNSVISDIKLTCLLNLSEEPYKGGEFYAIPAAKDEKFTTGMGLIMTSLIAHKVTPVTKGERITLTYWAEGPSWK